MDPRMPPRIKHRNIAGWFETKILKRALCENLMRAVGGENQVKSARKGRSHIASVLGCGLTVQSCLGNVGKFSRRTNSCFFPVANNGSGRIGTELNGKRISGGNVGCL